MHPQPEITRSGLPFDQRRLNSVWQQRLSWECGRVQHRRIAVTEC